ncbi:MAG: YeeE/YedE family protein, partial [Hyphomicrobiaceae bacterium]
CGYGTLARIGGGDLRALFGFLVLGIAAYMAIAGPTAQLRLYVLSPLAFGSSSAPNTFLQVAAIGPLTSILLPLAIAVGLGAWSLNHSTFRKSTRHVFWGSAVGIAILSGWLATGWLGADPFEPQPVVSHTFSVPLGQTLIFFMTMSSATVSFGIGGTLGVILGAFVGALIKKEFRWEGADDAREMRRHLVGAFLMGTGGVYAGGCTIGQGLSAASVLAISAPVVLASIWCGVWLGLNYMMEGSVVGGFRALMNR